MAGRLATACAAKLLLLLLLLMLPAVVQGQSYTDSYGTWYYTTTNDSITITNYSGPGGDVTIPDRIPDTTNGLPVTSIGDWAFSSSSLTSVTIPSGVTIIGDYAFYDCYSLTNVTIGNGVISIGDYAFEYCPLTSVTIPDSVTIIGDYAFYDCYSLTNVTIGNGVTSIGDYAFSGEAGGLRATVPRGCPLTSATIPNGVTNIGGGAFFYCYSLTSVTIPNSVINIGAEAFAGCSSLMAITVDTRNSVYSDVDGVLFNQSLTTLVQYPGGIAGSYTIPNSVTSIGTNAFYDCTSLTSVTIPNSVTSIGDYAFEDCTGLTNVTIGTNVTSIGDSAFAGSGLSNVTIPNSVTSIGDYAFEDCTGLANVTIGTNVTSIGGSAFASSGLSNVTIPNSVAGIGSYAFAYCYSLTNVTIPNSVTNIGDLAFFACLGLTAITVDTSNPAYSSSGGVLFDKSETTLIQCPGVKAGAYTIPNSVTNIGDYAFYYCTSLTSVTIGNSVTSIGDYAFAYSGLTNVTFPNSLTSIGELAFADTSLTSVTIPSSVTSLGELAFADCQRLKVAYFQGNAPTPADDQDPFYRDYNFATVYYLPGTTGWGWAMMFWGSPFVLWNPQVETSGASFGVRTNQFGFNITSTNNLVVVVEACTDLANPNWSPVATNTLTSGSSYFSDPQWRNYPARFYRLRSP